MGHPYRLIFFLLTISMLINNPTRCFGVFATGDSIAYLFIEAMAGFGESEFDVATDVAMARQTLDHIMVDIQGTDSRTRSWSSESH